MGKKVDVANAVIEGPLDLVYEPITREVSIKGSEFLNDVSFSNATAERLLDFSETTFCGNVNFSSATVKNHLRCEGAAFKREANFSGAEFMGSIYFGPSSKEAPTTFEGLATFRYCSVTKSADFSRAVFHQRADFAKVEIGDEAYFVSTRFKSLADFFGVEIKGEADFGYPWNEEHGRGPVFEDECIFYGTQFGHQAFFDRGIFDGKANFGALKVEGDAFFLGASFRQHATFDGAELNGKALFHGASFAQEADLVRTKVVKGAYFGDARVGRKGFRDYLEAAVFSNLASFYDSTFSSELHFGGDLRRYNLSEAEASAGIERTSRSIRLQGPIDLRGCTYDNISDTSWTSLLERYEQFMEEEQLFDPQPYIQLEKVFRADGNTRDADSVYARRRRREGQRKTKLYWIGDQVQRIVVGYGVGYGRLFGWILAFIVLGLFIFQLPGAVQPAADVPSGQPVPTPISDRCNDQLTNCEISWVEAAGVSLNTFLPIGLPIGNIWTPSGIMHYTIFASLLKLAGWIIIPLGIAAVTGFLQRAGPA